MRRQTLLVHVPSPFVVKNFLTTDAFTLLTKCDDLRIILLVPYFKEAYYRERFRSLPMVSVAAIEPNVLLNKLDLVYQFVIQNSLPTNTVRIKQYKFLFHGRRPSFVRFPLFLAARVLWYLGMIPAWKRLVGRCYRLLAPRSFKAIFDKHDISLLYVPNMLHSVDLRLILEARRRRIPVVGSIASWDNLTAKLVLPYPPDIISVGNPTVQEELIAHNGVPKTRVHIVGYPQYDRYLRREGIIERKEFCVMMGIDFERPYILYAMAGPKNMRSDIDVLRGIQSAMDDGRLPSDLQVLIRPYPKYINRTYEEKKLANDPRFIFDDTTASLLSEIDHWEFSDRDIAHLTNSIYHAAVIVTVASTILIDSAVLGRPAVNIAYSGTGDDTRHAYYHSPKRYLEYEHMQKLQNAHALISASTGDELIKIIATCLKSPDVYASERENLKVIQCGYTDGKSGERLGVLLSDTLNKLRH